MTGRPTPDESDRREETGGESLAPLIGEESWDEILRQLLADRPEAAEGLATWLLGLKDELESGPEGAARASEALMAAIRKVEGLSSGRVC